MSISEGLELFGLFGAVATLLFGIFQYQNAQQWKRTEWVAQEMKAIFADPMVDNTLKMIDWDGREILLFPSHPDSSKKHVPVLHIDVKKALRIHNSESAFTRSEAAIRDSFDRFFDGLERLGHYVEIKLIAVSEVQPFLKYWSNKVIKGDMSEEIKLYMKEYGYEDSQRLLEEINKLSENY
jgi:hypothetical protein